MRNATTLGTWIAVGSGILIWGELASWRASRQALPREPRAAADEAIIVLGFPSGRDDRPSFMQRYRTRIAVRSRNPEALRSVLVFTGRTPNRSGRHRSEAAVMADYAVHRLGVDPADVVLEEEATTTWENIARSIPLVRDFTTLLIASDTFHARTARRYLRTQAPQLAMKLRRADDYRVGELGPVRPVFAALKI